MQEQWKPIKGYEGLYEISNFGRVKSIKTNKIRKPNPDGSGYLKIDLYYKKYKTLKIHRLVAEAFIENKFNLPQVNHIDGNLLNNHYQNLEWCSPSYNSWHRTYILNKNSLHPCKPVKCVELNKNFNSISNAARYMKLAQPTITEVLNNPNRTAGGYHWTTK